MTTTFEPMNAQLRQFLLSRKRFYRLLHLLFSEPISTGELIQLANNKQIKDLEEIHEGGKILGHFFERLTIEQLYSEQREYERLFVGPGPLVAPPWESYYTSKEKILFDECTYQVREEYHRFGLRFIRENKEPDDHLLLELEFLIFLIELCMKENISSGLEELLQAQLLFLEDHLCKWIPYFCERLIESTDSQLYLGAAMLLEDFLNFDLQSLIEIREALPYA